MNSIYWNWNNYNAQYIDIHLATWHTADIPSVPATTRRDNRNSSNCAEGKHFITGRRRIQSFHSWFTFVSAKFTSVIRINLNLNFCESTLNRNVCAYRSPAANYQVSTVIPSIRVIMYMTDPGWKCLECPNYSYVSTRYAWVTNYGAGLWVLFIEIWIITTPST